MELRDLIMTPTVQHYVIRLIRRTIALVEAGNPYYICFAMRQVVIDDSTYADYNWEAYEILNRIIREGLEGAYTFESWYFENRLDETRDVLAKRLNANIGIQMRRAWLDRILEDVYSLTFNK